jgi:hypothetical protein
MLTIGQVRNRRDGDHQRVDRQRDPQHHAGEPPLTELAGDRAGDHERAHHPGDTGEREHEAPEEGAGGVHERQHGHGAGSMKCSDTTYAMRRWCALSNHVRRRSATTHQRPSSVKLSPETVA